MDDDGAVTEESANTGGGGSVELKVALIVLVSEVCIWGGRVWDVRCLEWTGGDFAMLAYQVTDLTCLRLSRVARGDFTTLGGVEVGQCFGAVPVCWHWLVVDVVDWRIVGLVCGQV